MDFPRDISEAKSHIAHIRREKGLDGPASNTSDLDAALILLSEQLYQKSTHFLLELLQNADDNICENDCPTLQMAYDDGRLQVSCNEVGFRRANVEAICRIGRSTKGGLGKVTGYIGEKGIGFKSVFKVANTVWVQSGFYSFKFDKREKLGMIAPIWTPFPGQGQNGFTSILLEMMPKQDHSGMLKELKSFDPRLLIFLRKLKRIEISIQEPGQPRWQTSLGREDDAHSGKYDFQRLSLRRDNDSLSFLVTRHAVTGLPQDAKRPGCSESEILMAFPIAQSGSPKISSQHVYAFLPIRDYGFKFLLQADFLLIASREDIDSYSMWNAHLRNAIPAATLKAVELLRETELKYAWPRYFHSRGTITDFFEKLETETIGLLSQSPILQSMDGRFDVPGTLTVVTEDYMDDAGSPLTLTSVTALRYLCPAYGKQDCVFLKTLGIKEMDDRRFFDDLEACLANPKFLDKKSLQWHSTLAQKLMAILSRNGSSIDTVRRLPIIPLRNGEWTNANASNILFPNGRERLAVPRGIEILEVHWDASTDPSRRNLLVFLGVQPFDASRICDIIADFHARQHTFFNGLPISSEVIEQAQFMFHANWLDPRGRKLWFVGEDNAFRRGDELYVITAAPVFIARILTELENKVQFLHPDYENTLDPNLHFQWAEWLATQGVNRFPRLVKTTSGDSFDLSSEFQYLMKTRPTNRVLHLLRFHWPQYCVWIEPRHLYSQKRPKTWEISRRALTDIISMMEVECRGGRRALLKDTMLLPEEASEQQSLDVQVPILDVPMRKNDLDLPIRKNGLDLLIRKNGHEWEFLKNFGVGSRDAADVLIKKLKSIKAVKTCHTTDAMAKLYEKLQFYMNDGNAAGKLWREFRRYRLIFIPPIQDAGEAWVTAERCVWSAPAYIKKTPQLVSIYPTLEPLFREAVGVRDMDFFTLLDELYAIQPKDSLEEISELFIAMSLSLRMDAKFLPIVQVKKLCQQRIFPIENTHVESQFESLKSAEASDIWFIADRPHLRQSFSQNIPLLAFGVETIARMETLLESFPKLQGRLLSRIAHGTPVIKGSARFHQEWTNMLRNKAKFIASIIPTEGTVKKDTIVNGLRMLQVFEAEKVHVEWTVKLSTGVVINGRANPGRVKVSYESGTLSIYLTKADFGANITPMELGEELCKYCGITGASEGILLQQILMSSDHAALKEIVERRGLVVENLEEDLGSNAFSSQQSKAALNKARQTHDDLCKDSHGSRQRENDQLLSFIQNIENANSVDRIISKRWEKHGAGQLNPMISRICRLERQDASILLPSTDSTSLKSPGSIPFDLPNQWSFTKPSRSTYEEITQAHEVYPALCFSTRKGQFVQRYENGGSKVTQEAKFLAELTVSRLLERQLGPSYSPTRHWTSSRRSQAGHMPFNSSGSWRDSSPFTIEDSGDFRSFLSLCGYKYSSRFPKGCVFHIEISTSEEEFSEAELQLDGSQMSKAQIFHNGVKRSQLTEVFILICVFKIWNNPQMFLFVDPWNLVEQGYLHISNPTCYAAQFLGDAPQVDLLELDQSQKKKTQHRSISDCIARWRESVVSSSSALGLYRYVRLRAPREIRLLQLEPGPEGAPLKASILHITLSSTKKTEFCAISYQWGADLKPYDVETPTGRIPITNSLHLALKCVRRTDQPLTVWADAVCINQDDNHEKCVQIRLMAEIFKSATCVYAWIGEEADRSSEVMETLIQIRTLALLPDRWPETLKPIPTRWRGHSAPPRDDEIWDFLDTMLDRGWFKRAWIVQEVVLAQNVILCCGSWGANLDDIFGALKICMREGRFGTSKNSARDPSNGNAYAAYVLGMTRKAFADPVQRRKYDLLSLVELFSYTQSTIKLDKLFSLLVLASDVAEEAFNPDYESSEEVVIRRFAEVFVMRGEAPRLLHRAGIGRCYSFCSWIPEWTKREVYGSISDWYGNKGRFSASGKLPLDCDVVSNHEQAQLRIRGIVVDEIKQVGPVTLEESDAITYLNSLQRSIGNLTSYPTGEKIDELKFRIPIGDASRPHLDTENDIAAYEGFIKNQETNSRPGEGKPQRRWTKDVNNDDKSEPFDYEDIASNITSLGEMMNFLKKPQFIRDKTWKYWHTAVSFAKRLSCARFCETERGYAGLVPQYAEAGQKIVLLHGMSVPFILSEKGDLHALVGECYIHGMMYGEALSFSGVKEVDFLLV